MTRHLQDMESQGLVERVDVEADQGGTMLALTATGVRSAEASENERVAQLGQVLAEWTDDRVACLAALLGDLDCEMAKGRVEPRAAGDTR
jgi:DNA-binding MarR family transcriptional regulator